MKYRTPVASLLLAGSIAVTSCGGAAGGAALLAAAGATQNQIRPMPRDEVQDGGTFTWPIDSMPPNFNYHQLDGTELANAQVISALLPTTFDSDAAGAPLWNHDLLAAEPVV